MCVRTSVSRKWFPLLVQRQYDFPLGSGLRLRLRTWSTVGRRIRAEGVDKSRRLIRTRRLLSSSTPSTLALHVRPRALVGRDWLGNCGNANSLVRQRRCSCSRRFDIDLATKGRSARDAGDRARDLGDWSKLRDVTPNIWRRSRRISRSGCNWATPGRNLEIATARSGPMTPRLRLTIANLTSVCRKGMRSSSPAGFGGDRVLPSFDRARPLRESGASGAGCVGAGGTGHRHCQAHAPRLGDARDGAMAAEGHQPRRSRSSIQCFEYQHQLGGVVPISQWRSIALKRTEAGGFPIGDNLRSSHYLLSGIVSRGRSTLRKKRQLHSLHDFER